MKTNILNDAAPNSAQGSSVQKTTAMSAEQIAFLKLNWNDRDWCDKVFGAVMREHNLVEASAACLIIETLAKDKQFGAFRLGCIAGDIAQISRNNGRKSERRVEA